MTRPLLLLAAALVIVTNLGALGLGALNRQVAETDIVLTERELRVGGSHSATSLRLNWTQAAPEALRGEMVAQVGFRTEVAATDPGADEYYSRQLQRRAYVALEYDGPAWAHYRGTLERKPPQVTLNLQQEQERRAAVARNVQGHTRLFAVDVDSDATRLRSRHPDRSRYLIADARANVMVIGIGAERRAVVSIRSVEPPEINVPRPFSATLRQVTDQVSLPWGETIATSPRYAVRLRYGRFHEPWIVSLQPLAAEPH